MADVVPRLARRRIAYISVATLSCIALAAFKYPVASPNSDIVIAAIYVFGGVILGYMGAQVAPELVKRP